jgi:monoamine oxidase
VVWDGNEEQKGTSGILTLLAGGSASHQTRELLARGGVAEIVKQLDWLSVDRTQLVTHRVFSWEDDPWAGGGYAYFSPSYDPSWRTWLARPTGRLLFAGEHTSFRWQGYMNGAVESGLRAAAEVRARQSGLL